MSRAPFDIAFTPTVKAVQAERGSRPHYERLEERGFRQAITAELTDFLAAADTAFLATVNAAGRPYAQHRGGPKGFIRVLDDKTLGWVDYAGNRQFISTGNLAENDRAFLFLINYAERRRVKIWGRARVVHGDAALIGRLMPQSYDARPEQAMLFGVEAWDLNCRQHIPQMLDAASVEAELTGLHARIAGLEAEINRLRARLQDGAVRSPDH